MKVLLIKDVRGVGQRHTVKEISDGYALNFLIPQGLAVQATPDKVAEFQKKQQLADASADLQKQKRKSELQHLDGKRIVMQVKANKEGHLFKGIRAEDIAAHVVDVTSGFFDASMILDLAGPIKEVGEFVIHAAGAGAEVAFTLVVEPASNLH